MRLNETKQPQQKIEIPSPEVKPKFNEVSFNISPLSSPTDVKKKEYYRLNRFNRT